jgi:hypothetical protein
LEIEIEENKKHFAELGEEMKKLELEAGAVMEAKTKAEVCPD